MATTTNYGWTTPDDTDLVKDGAAAIRTLGSSIDTTTKNLNPETTTGDLAYRSATANVKTRLALGTAGQVLRVNSGATAPEWATTADQTPLTTKGDLFGFDTADARIPIGTNGHVLTADSAQTLGLKWAAPAGGGKVLQVVSATYSTGFSTSSGTFVDTGLTASITPSSASSKVLILVSQNGCFKNADNSNSGVLLELLRGGTSIVGFAQSSGYTGSALYNVTGSESCSFLDTPATTSATTYKTRIRNAIGASLVGCQYDAATSTIVLLEIGA
jgi:hypothetical protein